VGINPFDISINVEALQVLSGGANPIRPVRVCEGGMISETEGVGTVAGQAADAAVGVAAVE
jgi:hypothetical protein